MLGVKLQPAIVCFSAPISTRETDREGQRQLALAQVSEMLGEKLQPAIICYSATTSTCETSGQGQRQLALALLSEMLGAKLEPSIICYSTPISARENAIGRDSGAGGETKNKNKKQTKLVGSAKRLDPNRRPRSRRRALASGGPPPPTHRSRLTGGGRAGSCQRLQLLRAKTDLPRPQHQQQRAHCQH
ncbi:unnamed protein product [Prorocentrum cordatum]|uniref:Uncharacterized protein n=1 Tax=Prorocentrum cordatum TaxID=2364126 RepID=A0ABN9YAH5_9DINO|nr:unnamed protein product [Polarella glacialis]